MILPSLNLGFQRLAVDERDLSLVSLRASTPEIERA